MKIPVFAALALLILTAQTPPPTTSADCSDTALPTSTFIKADSIAAKGPKGTISLVTVSDNASRERGLMCVVSIPHARGMIFIFPGSSNTSLNFWMKNTLVALDMVWVRTDGTVSSIAANVPPTPAGTPDDQIAHRDGIGHYVIEFGGGDAAKLGLKPGAKIRLPKLTATD
jgi:uncharacterized membrane protein (UPF0127 family)